jgi:hypothetical protein
MINIKIDTQEIAYSRSIYSVMTFLSDLGGLWGSLFVLGEVIVSVFIDRMFLAHLMKELY